MKHLSETELSALLDRVLDDRGRREAERHLERCEGCRAALAELESREASLRSALSYEPGEDYFATFAGRVEQRIRSRGATPARAERGLTGWLGEPRRLAWVGGAAAVVAAVGLVMIIGRETQTPELRKPELTRRANQVAGPDPASEGRARSAAPSPPEGSDQGRETKDRFARSLPPASKEAAPAWRGIRQDEKEEERAGQERQTREPAADDGSTAMGPLRSSAGPARAIRVKRDEKTGQEVPIDKTQAFKWAEPPASAPLAPGESPRLQKPRPAPLPAVPLPAPDQRASRGEPTAESSLKRLAAPGLAATADSMRAAGAIGRLCGVVRDHAGRPVAGAQVVIADLGLTAAAGRDGRYCVEAPAGTHTLSVMAVGFVPLRQTVEVPGGPAAGDVVLSSVGVLDAPRTAASTAAESVGGTVSWPPPVADLASRAERATRQAARLESASAFDRAADEWARVVGRLTSGPAALEALGRLADARYRAWETEPTPRRKASAIQALTTYRAKAPVGSARELAAHRLERLTR